MVGYSRGIYLLTDRPEFQNGFEGNAFRDMPAVLRKPL